MEEKLEKLLEDKLSRLRENRKDREFRNLISRQEEEAEDVAEALLYLIRGF